MTSCKESKQKCMALFHGFASLVILITITPVSYKLIYHHHHKTKRKRNKKLSVYGGITFCIITWLWIFNMFIMNITCIIGMERDQILIIRFIYVMLYLIQLYLMLLLFFLNIYYLFIDSPLKLSKLTIQIYSSLFIIIAMSCLIVTFTYSFVNIQDSVLMTGVVLGIIVVTLSAMVTLYIGKLISVYKLDTTDDNLVCHCMSYNIYSIIYIQYCMNIYIGICDHQINIINKYLCDSYNYGFPNIVCKIWICFTRNRMD